MALSFDIKGKSEGSNEIKIKKAIPSFFLAVKIIN